MPNRRRFSRVPFSTDCILRHSGIDYTVHLMDISLKGALTYSDTRLDLKTGDSCEFILGLDDNTIRLTFTGQIAHIEGDHYGVHFISTDINSMIHLRRLLEINMCNPDKLVSELSIMAHPD